MGLTGIFLGPFTPYICNFLLYQLYDLESGVEIAMLITSGRKVCYALVDVFLVQSFDCLFLVLSSLAKWLTFRCNLFREIVMEST